jgi:hypothetical protein
MKDICGHFFDNNNKTNVYIHFSKYGFFYITVSKSEEIVEWFVTKKAVVPFCQNRFPGFEIEESS